MKGLGWVQKKRIFFIVAFFWMAMGADHPAAKESSQPEATLIVPVAVLEKVLRESLPIEIEKLEGFTGKLWLKSIENLHLRKNVVAFKARLHGENLGYSQQIAGYKADMKFGKVDVAFDCSAAISYNKEKRLLKLKPRVNPVEKGNELVTPLLMALFNDNEYMVEIDKIEPIATHFGEAPAFVHVEVSSVATLDERLMIGLTPRIQKAGKKSGRQKP